MGLILTLDAGNTSIKMGYYNDQGHLIQYARVATDENKTSDEYGLFTMSVLQYAGLSRDDVVGVIISSVVPSLNSTLENMCHTFYHLDPLFVGPGVKTGMDIKYDNPKEVGSDRIATAVGAFTKYGGPCIVIDFGTATTLAAITEKGEFLGGAILPGVRTSLSSLVHQTAKLPTIELRKPPRAIGKNTVENMQSGLIHGYIGSITRLVSKIREEMNEPEARVIATGGLSRVLDTPVLQIIDSYLTLDGLYAIYQRNQEGK